MGTLGAAGEGLGVREAPAPECPRILFPPSTEQPSLGLPDRQRVSGPVQDHVPALQALAQPSSLPEGQLPNRWRTKWSVPLAWRSSTSQSPPPLATTSV